MPFGDGTGPAWAQGRGFGRGPGCRMEAGMGWRASRFGRCVLALLPEERKALLEQEKKRIEEELAALEKKGANE